MKYSSFNTLVLGLISLALIMMTYMFATAGEDTIALVLLIAGLIGIGITFVAGLAGIDNSRK